MARTNRIFDNDLILAELLKLKHFDPAGAHVTELDIIYTPPTVNGRMSATAKISLEIQLTEDEADDLLFAEDAAYKARLAAR